MEQMRIEKKESETHYNYGLDLIRIAAMFFVILVHSTSFYGFFIDPINSVPMFLAGMGRFLSYA